jgi:hypothetical protein
LIRSADKNLLFGYFYEHKWNIKELLKISITSVNDVRKNCMRSPRNLFFTANVRKMAQVAAK